MPSSKPPSPTNRSTNASPPTLMKRGGSTRTSQRSLPSSGSRSPSPIELSTKFGVHSSDRRGSEDYAHLTHMSDLSKLKAKAKPDDFRLSDFNLERIHRFVDEPQENIGKSMEAVLRSTEGKSKAIQGLVVPNMPNDGISYDKNLSNRQQSTPFNPSGSISYTHGKSLEHKIDRRTKQLKTHAVLEHQPELGPRSRFGDGDGTFWDRWVTTTGIQTKNGYVPTPFPSESSFKQGSTMPRSGYKRYSSGGDFQKKLIDTGNPNRVRPYSLYMKQDTSVPTFVRKPGQMQYSRKIIQKSKVNQKDANTRQSIKRDTPFNYSLEELMDSDSESSGSDFDEDSLISELSDPRVLRDSVNKMKRRGQQTFASTGSNSPTQRAMSQVTASRMNQRRGGQKMQKTLDKETELNYFGINLEGKVISPKKPKFPLNPNQPQPNPESTMVKIVPEPPNYAVIAYKNGKVYDYSKAKDQFYELHHQLQRQREKFTEAQYDTLLDLAPDAAEEEARMIALGGRVRSDAGEDSISSIPKLDLTNVPKNASVFDREEEDDGSFNIDYLASIAGKIPHPTARTKFLYGCIQARDGMGLPPRLGPIIRKKGWDIIREISLAHQGMGDELAMIFASALSSLPEVGKIDVSDNRLSDIGVAAILDSVMDKADLSTLIIGHNKVDGDAAEKLAEYIAREDCPLTTLGLSHADVDDGECFRFIEALATNQTLTSLDMSNNLIGSDENLNVVNPDLITGGEAIAAMLASEGCRLKKLNLEWNLLRFNSAVEIGDALALNTSLEELDLAYNAFGADGGMAIGQALIENTKLLRLDLRNNGITPQAGFCIAVALRQNVQLRKIDLGGNPLGEIGGKTLMSLPMDLGDRLDLILDGCNFKNHDENCWFDPEGPSGHYTEIAMRAREEILEKTNRVQLEEVKGQLHPSLDLSLPYDRAVLIELLRFIADKDGCAIITPDSTQTQVEENFVELWYHPEGTSTSSKPELVVLDRVVEEAMPNDGDEELVKWINGERDPREVFDRFDVDNSGEIDRDELKKVFKEIGKDASDREIDRVMTQFDLDGSGDIEFDEFLAFLNQLQSEISEMRLKRKFMSADKKVPWRAPLAGKVQFKVLYNPRIAAPGQGSSTNNETLDRVLSQVKKTNGESSTMLAMSLSLMRLGVEEAQRVFDELLKGIGDRVETLKMLLPVIANPQQVRVFIDMNLRDRDPYRPGAKCKVVAREIWDESGEAQITHVDGNDPNMIEVTWIDDKKGTVLVHKDQITLKGAAAVTAETEKRRLQGALGNCYYPIMGIPTAHYKLDMSKGNDRMCLQKLSAVNNTESNTRRASRLGDTSQKGNWMNFRNEVYRGQPFTITPWFLDPVPKSGILEFDYVSTFRPVATQQPLSEKRFLQLVGLCFNTTTEQGDEDELLLKALSKELNYDWEHGLWTPKIRNMKGMEKFGLDLATLMGEVTPSALDLAEEKAKKELEDRPKTSSEEKPGTPNSRPGSRPGGRTGGVQDSIMDAVRQRMGGLGGTPASKGDSGPSSLPKMIPGNRFSIMLSQKGAAAPKAFNKMKRMSNLMMAAAKIQKRAKKRINALKLLQQMQDLVSMKWISALQARFMLEKYSRLIGISSEDMKLKLNLVCTLHMRIIDLYNFDVVLGALDHEEQAHIIFRLGWLNTWSPIKPDTHYELSHVRREERLISKALLHLAVEEPGDNWWNETFQWNRFDKVIPGWELPITWFTESGMPSKGILKLEYYSGEGKGLKDCAPRWRLRNALSGLVLAPSPQFLMEDEKDERGNWKYKSTLRNAKTGKLMDQLSTAQKMLTSGGIMLNYKEGNTTRKKNRYL
ncbi:hypothetical protein TrLO_g5454 [Triparma laevis f. longispina]|uniref:EF-hand domain-containing protein n=1 Tax=Triparma laevis f. longispina TaxID=1714387 RepID=A0A9W7DKG1_9STRA|nr:hypothetical protein TrLO_g5454 [Triparma laevis f. longispina]